MTAHLTPVGHCYRCMAVMFLEVQHHCADTLSARIEAAGDAICVARAFSDARIAVLACCGDAAVELERKTRELEAECVAAARGVGA